ncbi:MAG: amidohydrolase family protein [Acidimicrobiales bacterium]
MILDAHHHLWPGYTVDELHADIGTVDVVGTVFVECHSNYRTDGPPELRSLGETEFVTGQARRAIELGGPPIVAIVGNVDLTLPNAEDVLAAHVELAGGLFRGVRHTTAWDPSPMNNAAPRGAMMSEEAFRNGVRTLGRLGLSFDCFCFHPQLTEAAALAAACDTTIVLNHFGVPIAGGPYRGRTEETRALWKTGITAMAAQPNVVCKLGAVIRPLSGERWDRQPAPPTAEEVARAWGDEIRFVIDAFGPHRCLFESNFPVDKPCVPYAVLWEAFAIASAGYSAAERQDLFHDTAARAYRITAR